MISLLLALAASAAPPVPGFHAADMAAHPDRHVVPPVFRLLPEPTPGPDVVVYGYQAYWSDDLGAVPWDQLTHLALFSAGTDSSGNLSSTDRWDLAADAVAMGAPYGVHVHLVVTDFDADSIKALLASKTARTHLIDQLVEWEQSTGAQGVNIDFEGVSSSSKADLVTFAQELHARCGEVVFAAPAVDWSGAWDYSELTKVADLFVMAYDYHWSGSDYAGPVDPLYGGGDWSDYAIDWTVDDYRSSGADMSHVIVGLPLYGYRWPTSSGGAPVAATGTGKAVLWADAQADMTQYGAGYDASTESPYWYDGSGEGWCNDVDTLRDRIAYAVAEETEGVGFWALHYDDDDPAVWSMIGEETTFDLPAAPGDYTADAGAPFLAYVGDHVVLSGEGSTGPDGVDLQYLWTQVSGPRVTLSSQTVKEPEFDVKEPGVTVFELRVGDGTDFSTPSRSYVVVVDRDAGQAHDEAKGGCDTSGGAASWLAFSVAATTAIGARRSRAADTGARGTA